MENGSRRSRREEDQRGDDRNALDAAPEALDREGMQRDAQRGPRAVGSTEHAYLAIAHELARIADDVALLRTATEHDAALWNEVDPLLAQVVGSLRRSVERVALLRGHYRHSSADAWPPPPWPAIAAGPGRRSARSVLFAVLVERAAWLRVDVRDNGDATHDVTLRLDGPYADRAVAEAFATYFGQRLAAALPAATARGNGGAHAPD
jgi:hypothetical protein